MILKPFRPDPNKARAFRRVCSPDQTQFRAMGWSLRGPRAWRWADALLAIFVMGFLAAVVATPFLAMLALLKWLFW